MPKQERGLGRGLDALFAGAMDDGDKDRVIEVEIKDIKARADQPRRVFNSEALQELADSLQEHGVLQPLLVQAAEGGRYRIVAGERRWRAARMAGLEELPVQVIDLSAAGGQPMVDAELGLAIAWNGLSAERGSVGKSRLPIAFIAACRLSRFVDEASSRRRSSTDSTGRARTTGRNVCFARMPSSVNSLSSAHPASSSVMQAESARTATLRMLHP